MSLLESIILGIVQGLTEFLPVSSSGHLALAQKLFGIGDGSLFFEILLHVATLIPVLIVFRKDVIALIKKPFQKMTYLLITATLPAVIFTVLFGDYFGLLYESATFLAAGFIITGCLLLFSDKVRSGHKREKDISYADALIIGTIQGIAIAPAISRSGSTISGSLFRKINREAAAKFSFLMSIPAIAGGLVLEIAKIIRGDIVIGGVDWLVMGGGFVAAMLSGFLAISFMMALIRRCKLRYFSIYVFLLAAVILVDQLALSGVLFH
jgi:undecaprenyl-diphosphatase